MQTLTGFPPEILQVKVNFDGILKAVPAMFPALEDIQLLNDEETQKKMQAAIDQQKKLQMLLELGGPLQSGGQPMGQPARKPVKAKK
jgi:hypothetical protein